MTDIKPERKFSLKKRKIEDPGLLNSLNNELPKNSAVVNKVLFRSWDYTILMRTYIEKYRLCFSRCFINSNLQFNK